MRVGLLPRDAALLCERDVNGIHTGTISRSGCGLCGRIRCQQRVEKKEKEKEKEREKKKVAVRFQHLRASRATL